MRFEKGFILGPHSISVDFTAYIGANRFKHGNQSPGLIEIAENLKTFLDFGRLLVGVTAWTIGHGRPEAAPARTDAPKETRAEKRSLGLCHPYLPAQERRANEEASEQYR